MICFVAAQLELAIRRQEMSTVGVHGAAADYSRRRARARECDTWHTVTSESVTCTTQIATVACHIGEIEIEELSSASM